MILFLMLYLGPDSIKSQAIIFSPTFLIHVLFALAIVFVASSTSTKSLLDV